MQRMSGCAHSGAAGAAAAPRHSASCLPRRRWSTQRRGACCRAVMTQTRAVGVPLPQTSKGRVSAVEGPFLVTGSQRLRPARDLKTTLCLHCCSCFALAGEHAAFAVLSVFCSCWRARCVRTAPLALLRLHYCVGTAVFSLPSLHCCVGTAVCVVFLSRRPPSRARVLARVLARQPRPQPN